MRDEGWSSRPGMPRASADEIHVWRVRLERPHTAAACREDDLSPEERVRAAALRFLTDRARFVATRTALRRILGAYSDTEPARLHFAYGPHGKPELRDHPDLSFNVSHSGELALVAVTRRRPVGIDVERVREDVSIDELATLVFTDRERRALGRSPGSDGASRSARELADFFVLWTCKEAVMKAIGAGVWLPPQSVEVSLASQPPVPTRVGGDAEAARRWSLKRIDVGPGYAAAVAAEGGGWRVRCLDWRGMDERA